MLDVRVSSKASQNVGSTYTHTTSSRVLTDIDRTMGQCTNVESAVNV